MITIVHRMCPAVDRQADRKSTSGRWAVPRFLGAKSVRARDNKQDNSCIQPIGSRTTQEAFHSYRDPQKSFEPPRTSVRYRRLRRTASTISDSACKLFGNFTWKNLHHDLHIEPQGRCRLSLVRSSRSRNDALAVSFHPFSQNRFFLHIPGGFVFQMERDAAEDAIAILTSSIFKQAQMRSPSFIKIFWQSVRASKLSIGRWYFRSQS